MVLECTTDESLVMINDGMVNDTKATARPRWIGSVSELPRVKVVSSDAEIMKKKILVEAFPLQG